LDHSQENVATKADELAKLRVEHKSLQTELLHVRAEMKA